MENGSNLINDEIDAEVSKHRKIMGSVKMQSWSSVRYIWKPNNTNFARVEGLGNVMAE